MSEKTTLLTVSHHAGFFSCTTVLLEHILTYFNQYHVPPFHIDSSNLYTWSHFPTVASVVDNKSEYFIDHTQYGESSSIEFRDGDSPICTTYLPIEQQYVDSSHLNYTSLRPFIQRYFTPSVDIQHMIRALEDKYEIEAENTCVLFFRGNDKATEIALPSYEQYIEMAKILLSVHPTMRFLVQSDETEFLDRMKAEFPGNHVVFYDEIRHMSHNPWATVDHVFPPNRLMTKFYLAITVIMSKCKYVVCGSGNCSLWIALFRGHSKGVVQFGYRT